MERVVDFQKLQIPRRWDGYSEPVKNIYVCHRENFTYLCGHNYGECVREFLGVQHRSQQYFSHVTTYRRQANRHTRTMMLLWGDRSLHSPLNAELLAYRDLQRTEGH